MAQTASTGTKGIAEAILARLLALTGISSGYDYPIRDMRSALPCVVVFYNGDRNEPNTNQTFMTEYTYKVMLYKSLFDGSTAWDAIQDLRDLIVDSIHSDRSLDGKTLEMLVTTASPFIDDQDRCGVEFTLQIMRYEEYI